MYQHIFSLKRKILTFFFNRWYLTHPPEMVTWWKKTSAIEASLRMTDDGSHVMYMGNSRLGGEKYPFRGFPRGALLYGKLSPLKHQIKNQIFNDSWWKLENGEDPQTVVQDIKGPILDNILKLGAECKYDMVSPEKFVPPVKEIHRAFTKVIKGHPQELRLKGLRDILCFILQEDDAYRMRVQWMAQFYHPFLWNILDAFDFALSLLEPAEILDDMKERQRLLRRILMLVAKHTTLFKKFAQELDWKKIKLTKADKYYFRGKYYRVDYDKYDY